MKQKRQINGPARETVLIADACELNRRILRYLLHHRFDTLESVNAAEAASRLSQRTPRLSCLIINARLAAKATNRLNEALAGACSRRLPVVTILPEGQRPSTVPRILREASAPAISTPFDETELLSLVEDCVDRANALTRSH